jgi:hypothetical protein
MVAGFKADATARINRHRGTPGAPVWQARFHDRILRDERAWRAAQAYIAANPARWHADRHASPSPVGTTGRSSLRHRRDEPSEGAGSPGRRGDADR